MTTNYSDLSYFNFASISRSLSTKPKKIVGFSKGVVVLNQLMIDSREESGVDFFKLVETMCWLDGAHNGGLLTWMSGTFCRAYRALKKPFFCHFVKSNKDLKWHKVFLKICKNLELLLP